jgi:hypothetical protein
LRVAALYDVHGFRLPLEEVLAEVDREGADAIVFGGDLFLGPQPAEQGFDGVHGGVVGR